MIVRQFLQWIGTAPAAERADATADLVRCYLHSQLSPDDLAAAEGALLMLLDDPSPLVRRALAETICASDRAPASVVYGLAADQANIAIHVYEYSPLLTDADLVDAIGQGDEQIQAAVARRDPLSRSVVAAIAEVGTAEACLTVLENPGAVIAQFSLERLVARYGHLAAIRETLLERDDLPAPIHQVLVAKLSDVLAGFVSARCWLPEERASRVAKEACEKAAITLAASARQGEQILLIRHLRSDGQLTAQLILRALLSGNVAMFEDALAELSGMPIDRVCGLLHSKGGTGLRAVYDKAGLPASLFVAFKEAMDAIRETGFVGDHMGEARLRRRVVERVLTRCAQDMRSDVEPLLILLRRFAAEAAREEARMFCSDLVAERMATPLLDERLVA